LLIAFGTLSRENTHHHSRQQRCASGNEEEFRLPYLGFSIATTSTGESTGIPSA
jgi:hypothetical protein